MGIVAQGQGVDQGVRTSPDVVPGLSTVGRIALLSPDLYLNWDVNTPKFIAWDSYGAAAGAAISIQLWQNGAAGPQEIATIAASTPDTGSYIWTPSDNDIAPGTTGLRIRIASVANPAIYDMSTEPFTVPAAGETYYVAADGSNRNTGKSAASPLPGLDNVFWDYTIGAGSTVDIAAGAYALIAPLQLSGSANRGFGLESGFTIDGASGGGTILSAANPDVTPPALIQLTDSSFDSLNNLTFEGGVDALVVGGGSDDFVASYLTASGSSGAAFVITTNSPTGALDHLTATNAGGAGLQFSGAIGAITNFIATDDHDGIIGTGSIGLISGADISGNAGYGLYLTLTGSSVIKGNEISDNSTGAYLDGSGIVFGDPNLSDADGNIVSGNTSEAIEALGGVTVVGNSISNNTGRFQSVEIGAGGSFSYNLLFGNVNGAEIDATANVIGNRVFDNAGYGLSIDGAGGIVSQNTLYLNGFGIQVEGSGQTLSNNLIYSDTYAGISLFEATGVNIVNNTIYEPTAGTVSYLPNPGYASGAIVLDQNSTGATLSNNIIVALAGIGVNISNTSQPGFVSNYNLYQTGSGGRVGIWLGLTQTSLSQWRSATGQDANAQFGNPFFVSPTANGATDDYHIMSVEGSDHGGSLSAIVGANGLPQLTTGVYTDDASSSPAIASGNPATPLGAEPSPNGGIVEIGAYGGTMNHRSLLRHI